MMQQSLFRNLQLRSYNLVTEGIRTYSLELTTYSYKGHYNLQLTINITACNLQLTATKDITI
jgi:hypothetical protein